MDERILSGRAAGRPRRTNRSRSARVRSSEFIGQTRLKESSPSSCRGPETAGAARPRPALRPSGPRQDDARAHHRPRDGRRRSASRPARPRAGGRSRRDPDESRAGRRPVHRRDPPRAARVEEILYPAMEDASSTSSSAPARRAHCRAHAPAVHARGRDDARRAPVQPFRRASASPTTSTTTTPALATIVTRSSDILSCLVPAGAAEIARRTRGTPRIANRLLRRVRDSPRSPADRDHRARAGSLSTLEVDRTASTRSTAASSRSSSRSFRRTRRPVHARALARRGQGHARGPVRAVPALQSGFLQRTPKGRVASALAYRHLGLKPMAGPGRARSWVRAAPRGGASSSTTRRQAAQAVGRTCLASSRGRPRRGLELRPLPTERPRHATELVSARLGEALDLRGGGGRRRDRRRGRRRPARFRRADRDPSDGNGERRGARVRHRPHPRPRANAR